MEFHLEGEYVVFSRLPGTTPEGGGGKGCGCQAPAEDAAPRALPWIPWLLVTLLLLGWRRGRRR